jgi:hypothetical protein
MTRQLSASHNDTLRSRDAVILHFILKRLNKNYKLFNELSTYGILDRCTSVGTHFKVPMAAILVLLTRKRYKYFGLDGEVFDGKMLIPSSTKIGELQAAVESRGGCMNGRTQTAH